MINIIKIYKIKTAFTLAEVLITLLIIGVVASIVIPSLVNNSQDAEFKAAWKKEFGVLDQATRMVMNDNGGTLIAACPNDHDHVCLRNLIRQYLKYTKTCALGQSLGNCWHADNTSKTLAGTPISWENSTSIILTDGTLIQIFYYSKDCNRTNGNLPNICGKYQVDINGFKKPNIMGKDIFQIYITSTGIKPYGTQGDSSYNSKPSTGCDLTADPNATGDSCPADLLYQ